MKDDGLIFMYSILTNELSRKLHFVREDIITSALLVIEEENENIKPVGPFQEHPSDEFSKRNGSSSNQIRFVVIFTRDEDMIILLSRNNVRGSTGNVVSLVTHVTLLNTHFFPFREHGCSLSCCPFFGCAASCCCRAFPSRSRRPGFVFAASSVSVHCLRHIRDDL